jgi:DUF1680 family protein
VTESEKNPTVIISALAFIFLLSCSDQDYQVAEYPIHPVHFTAVKLNDSFWQARLKTNHEVSIPHAFSQSEITGRIDNFEKAAGVLEGKYKGYRFNDSDVYKIIEGASYSLSLYPEPELDAYLDELIEKIAAAQEEATGHAVRTAYMFSWAHRGPGPMIVWFARDPGVAWAKPHI